MIGAWILAAAFAGGDPCADAAKAQKAADELKALWQQDQADHEANVEGLAKLDKKRVKAAKKLAPMACTGEAKFWAGALLFRADDPELLEQAHELGKAAMMEHVRTGPWLTAVTFDKWQVLLNLPQRYATQMTNVEGRGACLYPVVPDSTDEERATYGLPPIADAFRRVLDANGLQQEPATADAVAAKKLWCDPSQW